MGRRHPTPLPEDDQEPAAPLDKLAQSNSGVAAREGSPVQDHHVALRQSGGAGRSPRDAGCETGPVGNSQGASEVQVGLAAAQRVHDQHVEVAAGRRDEVQHVVRPQRVVREPEFAPGEGVGQGEGSEGDRRGPASGHGDPRAADFRVVHEQGDLHGDLLRRAVRVLRAASAGVCRHHSRLRRKPFPASGALPAQLQSRQRQVDASRDLVADHQGFHLRPFGKDGVPVGSPSRALKVADDHHPPPGEARSRQHRSRQLHRRSDPGGQRRCRQSVQRLDDAPGIGGRAVQQDGRFGEGDQRHPVRRSQRFHDRSGHGHALLPVVGQSHGVGTVQEHDHLFGTGAAHRRQRTAAHEGTGEGEDDQRQRRQPHQQKRQVAQAQARLLPEGNPLQEHERRKGQRLAPLLARQVEQDGERQARQGDQKERGEEAHRAAGDFDRAFTEP